MEQTIDTMYGSNSLSLSFFASLLIIFKLIFSFLFSYM